MADDFAPIFDAAGKQYDIDPRILRAVSMVESGGNPDTQPSKAGALGLMQFMPETAKSLGIDPSDPKQAIFGAARLLAESRGRYGNMDDALRAYNGGTDPTRWGNAETAAYVPKVLAAYRGLSAQTAAPTPAAQAIAQGMANADAQKTPGVQVAVNTDSSTASDAGSPRLFTAADVMKALSGGQTPAGGASAGVTADDLMRALQGGANSAEKAKADTDAKTPGLINGAVRAVADGLTFGLADKAEAATQAVPHLLGFNGPTYSDALAGQRQTDANFSAAHPLLNAGGEVTGNVLGAVASNALVPGLGVAGAGVSTAGRLGRLAALGAGVGAADAVGHNDAGLADKAKAAAGGAVTGAIFAPAVDVAGRTAVGAANNLLIQPALDRFGQGPATAAARKVAQAISRDGMTPDDVQARLNALGPNAAIVDAGGANVRGLGETAANMPGEAAQKAQTFLEERMAGQGDRLKSAVTQATGGAGDVHADADALMASRAAAARPLYEGALDVGPVTSDRIKDFLADPITKAGLAQGIKIQRLEALAEGRPFNPHDYAVVDFNEAGDPIIGEAPNMRTLDAVKRGLDDMVEKYRDPTTGKLVLDQMGRAIDKVRKSFVGAVDEAQAPLAEAKGLPTYAEARAAWAGPSQSLDALAMGRAALKNDPEVTAKIVSGLSDGDKQFFLNGVARSLRDAVDRTPDSADAVRRIFGNPAIRGKIEAAFDDPAAFSKFQQQMESEAQFARTRNEVLKGSQTARRLAGQEDSRIDPGFLVDIAHGHFLRAGMGALRAGYNALTRPPAAQGPEMGNLLFTPGDNAANLAAIRNRLAAQGVKQAQINALLRNTGVTAAGLSGSQIGASP